MVQDLSRKLLSRHQSAELSSINLSYNQVRTGYESFAISFDKNLNVISVVGIVLIIIGFETGIRNVRIFI